MYEGSKNKIYLIKELLELRFIPESSGLCIFRFDKTPKPTTNFLQLFSADISKNVLDIGEKDLINYNLLTPFEKDYLFRYHLNVYSKLSKYLKQNERK